MFSVCDLYVQARAAAWVNATRCRLPDTVHRRMFEAGPDCGRAQVMAGGLRRVEKIV
jgi:hypothetical protein